MIEPLLRERLTILSTAMLADARCSLGLPEMHLDSGIRPVVPFSRMLGTAVTIELETAATPEEADLTPMSDAYEVVPPGADLIAVIAVPAELHSCGIFGEGAATVTRAHGFVGALVEGAVRDSHELRDMAFPVFSRTLAPGYIVFRSRVAAVGAPVEIGGRRICQGDLIVADNDGVMVLEPEQAVAVADKAAAILDWEHRMHALMADGMSTADALKACGNWP